MSKITNNCSKLSVICRLSSVICLLTFYTSTLHSLIPVKHPQKLLFKVFWERLRQLKHRIDFFQFFNDEFWTRIRIVIFFYLWYLMFLRIRTQGRL
jgi:hypothetical protein